MSINPVLMGVADNLNGKSHPWEGTRDPRADIFSPGVTKGVPYGAPSIYSAKLRAGTPNWYNSQPGHLNPDFKIPLMTYAELQFILSEYKGFSDAEFKAGIEVWLNGTEAWTEIRRTGYPEQVLRPGEYTCEDPNDASAEPVKFTALSEVKGDIIARVKYPTNESTLNGENWKAAVAKLQDGTNNYYSKMFWDVRTSTYDHPANK